VHDLISLGDARYPNSLLHTADPPLLLYAIGARAVLQRRAPLHDWQRSIAIVGSRNPTPQGASHAQAFAHDLVQAGWCIVSGMALGVDAAAHHGALQLESAAAPCTIAVVGTGLDIIYPRQHALLAQSIAQRGLLLSEFPLGTPPIASNFPKRNRIISGLSRGTLVVEAALASGSLITARTASEQGREVFAIPGSIHSPQSRGCHALIRQGAKLVECTQDILEEWSTTPTVAAHADGTAVQASNEALPAADADTPLLRALGYDPVDLDTLSARSGMGAGDLQAQLLELELQGQVTRLPGGWFQRHSRA
jgi:DNA processing protein